MATAALVHRVPRPELLRVAHVGSEAVGVADLREQAGMVSCQVLPKKPTEQSLNGSTCWPSRRHTKRSAGVGLLMQP